MLPVNELVERHAEALYVHDARDQMVAAHDVDRTTAPRLHVGRTVEELEAGRRA